MVQDYGLFSFAFSAFGWGVVTTDFSCCSGQNVQNGSRRLLFSGGSTVPGSVTMARIDGGLFSVSSFHAATAFIESGGSLTVKGYFPDATSVSTSFEIGDSFAGLALSEAFSGLSSIEFAEGTVAGWRETASVSTTSTSAAAPRAHPRTRVAPAARHRADRAAGMAEAPRIARRSARDDPEGHRRGGPRDVRAVGDRPRLRQRGVRAARS